MNARYDHLRSYLDVLTAGAKPGKRVSGQNRVRGTSAHFDHVIEQRFALGAEEEMRFVFDAVAHVVLAEAPALFQDFERAADGSWTATHHKV